MLKRWNTYLLILLATLVGCSGEGPDVSTEAVSVHLILSMPGTKADYVTDYETEAFGNDYYIHPYDVEVVVYNPDGSYKDRAVMTQVNPADNYHTYTLTGLLTAFTPDELTAANEYKIVVITNKSGHCPAPFPYASLETLTEAGLYSSLTYSYSADIGTALTRAVINKEERGRIPMWGSKTTTITNGGSIQIDMLRAMAKVEVGLSAEMTANGEELQSVTLVQGVDKGYLTPANASGANETTDAWSTGTAVNQHIPTDAATNLSVPFTQHNGKYYLYLPEQAENTRGEGTTAKMSVRISGKAYDLFFAEYGTDGPKVAFPVLRNHHYSYNITGIAETETERELTVNYTVCPWEQKSSNIEFN